MMRDCELTHGCLGTIKHKHRVYTGCTYSHSFKPGNPPQFLDGKNIPSEPDVILEAHGVSRKKRKDELSQDLEAARFNPKGRVKDLKARCEDAGIPMMMANDKKLSGYINKPKGALDIAYEHGLIDPSKQDYDGKLVSWQGAILKKDATEAPDQPQECCQRGSKQAKRRDLSTSLKYILGNCVAANLEENVKKALSTQEVLIISKTQKFVRKARDYTLTYFCLISMIDTAMVRGVDGRVVKDAIEKIVKAFKVH
jgi:hypothetical protein